MKGEALDQTLSRAITALQNMSPAEIKCLPLLDCAFTLSVLPDVDGIKNLRVQLVERIEKQLSPKWIMEADLFAVFSALTTLWQYDSTRVTGDYLTSAIQRLFSCEEVAGGPYHSGGKVELAANLQISSFVRLVAKPLPNVDAFFDRVIKIGHFEKTELASPYMLYLFTRTYDDPAIGRYIKQCRNQTPEHRAVALAILKDELPVVQRQLAAIYNDQQPTGFWAGQSSDVVATALITGILYGYQQKDREVAPTSEMPQRHQEVAQATKELFDTVSEPLRSATLAYIDKVCGAERGFEITLISYVFAEALNKPPHTSRQQFTQLGVASVCGWVAYTIYDDFLDEEGVPAQLPIANIAMRASLACFRASLPANGNFQQTVDKVFTGLDEANAWEISNCRFVTRGGKITIDQLPKYDKCAVLAARSFGHALGPLAVLAHDPKCTSKQVDCIDSAFRHFLIARQLWDDVHDWHDDIHAGHASYVATSILRDMQLKPGSYSLPVLTASMQKQFRSITMPSTCKLILSHISKSRRSFEKSGLLRTTNGIYDLLDKLELSATSSLDQHAKAQALTKMQTTVSSVAK